ncbi:hypothetical protein [Petroclostridium xylanilyticum]|uniref:hypothetical protein n=1 Tax=Petroclostridium xylanilyticum TaxID=1792311 RepID=UPI000B987548|nr:hypothetical protein [Petroclostridium xylanilyticum]
MLKNYVRNFETQQTVTMEKLKPEIIPVKGHAKIELFNSLTGKKTLEAETENVINSVLAKEAFLTTFDSLIGWDSLGSSARRSYFQDIVLTNYTGAESADNFYVAGDIVGWARKQGPYVGADTKRGTINIAESIRDYGQFKFVFDWPTHAGNGTFRTIWWTGQYNSYMPTIDFYSLYDYSVSGSIQTSYRACIGPGFAIYIPQNTGVILVRKMSYNDMSYPDYYSSSLSSDTLDLSYIDTKIQAIHWDGMYFWLYGDTNGRYYKCDESFAVLCEFDAPPAAYSRSTRQNITTFNGKFFSYTYEANNNWSFRRYNHEGILESELNLYGATGVSDPGSTYIVGEAKCILFHSSNLSRVAMLDSYGNTLKHTVSAYSFGSLYGPLMYDRKHNLFWSRYSYSGNYRLYCLQPMWYPGAQTLLAAPVTKTNTNTMKITYTFQVNLPVF